MSISTAAVLTLAALATGELPHISDDLAAPAAPPKWATSPSTVWPGPAAITIHKVAAKPTAPERLELPERMPGPSPSTGVLPSRPIAASPVLHHHLSQLEDAWIVAQAEPEAIASGQIPF